VRDGHGRRPEVATASFRGQREKAYRAVPVRDCVPMRWSGSPAASLHEEQGPGRTRVRLSTRMRPPSRPKQR
jgi:hypothetical protein